MDLNIELFAQIPDMEHDRLSVILSGDQIILEPEGQPRFLLSKKSFDRLGDLVRRHEAAIAAANG